MINDILKKMKTIMEYRKDEIIEILRKIENSDEASFEFDISFRALSSHQKYCRQTNTTLSAFLPMNLPLYSLVLYVIIPRLCCSNIYYKPSNLTMEIAKRLHKLLELDNYEIHLIEGNRRLFLKQYAENSEVVIFTGKPGNAKTIKEQLPPTTLFMFFGSAQNPIVVESDAELAKASDVIYESTIFNYGQDCAKPSAVFVKASVAEQLVCLVIDKIVKDANYRCTSIKDVKELLKVGQLLLENRHAIVYGGCIDYGKLTMEPVVLSMPMNKNEKCTNEEFYAPVFKFFIFSSFKEIENYLKSEPKVVTLFGNNCHLEAMKSNILLYEETIAQLDKGNTEFGGFGYSASFLSYYGIVICKPLMVNREISFFLDNRAIVENISFNYKAKKRKRELLIQMFKDKIIEVFEENLIVSFVFGSYAKFEESQTSDIDVFIGVKNVDETQVNNFRKWYFETHYMFGLVPDFQFPGEIIAVENLYDIIRTANSVTLQLCNDADVYNVVFFTQILLDKKIYLFGSENSIEIENSFLENVALRLCRQTEKILVELAPDKYNEYSNKINFFQPSKDLCTIFNMLTFNTFSNGEYLQLIEEMDDGMLLKIMRIPPESDLVST